MKCQVCGVDEPVWAYQPFGPDENPHQHMAMLGSHYRGFAVVKVCQYCHDAIAKGTPTEFDHKGKHYIASCADVRLVPDYVSDPLLWFESTLSTQNSE